MSLNILDNEDTVYQIIQEYLIKKNSLKLDEVIPYVKARLSKIPIDLNEKGIIVVIQSLIDKNIIVGGFKLTKDEILETPKRMRIYEYIIENPGVYFYQIVKNLEFSKHVVRWHLDVLLKFDFINIDLISNARNKF